jgi:hypothetical protein
MGLLEVLHIARNDERCPVGPSGCRFSATSKTTLASISTFMGRVCEPGNPPADHSYAAIGAEPARSKTPHYPRELQGFGATAFPPPQKGWSGCPWPAARPGPPPQLKGRDSYALSCTQNSSCAQRTNPKPLLPFALICHAGADRPLNMPPATLSWRADGGRWSTGSGGLLSRPRSKPAKPSVPSGPAPGALCPEGTQSR